MLRPRLPKKVTVPSPPWEAGTKGAVVKLAGFKYPLFTRSWMLPLVRPADMDEPASSPPKVAGVRPGPRKAVPAAKAVTEKGVPDWKMVMPLIAQPLRAVRFQPSALE